MHSNVNNHSWTFRTLLDRVVVYSNSVQFTKKSRQIWIFSRALVQSNDLQSYLRRLHLGFISYYLGSRQPSQSAHWDLFTQRFHSKLGMVFSEMLEAVELLIAPENVHYESYLEYGSNRLQPWWHQVGFQDISRKAYNQDLIPFFQ